MSTPIEAPANDPLDTPMAGFGWCWAAALGSTVLAFVVGWLIDRRMGVTYSSDHWSLLAGMIPPLSLLGLLAGSWFSGRKRMALGVLAAFGSMFAVMLLLIAGCFGIFGFAGF